MDTNRAGPEEIGSELERIQSAVEGGDTDLSRLGFWPLVDRLKSSPDLAERFADTAGRIDGSAFEQRIWPRFPVWFGNAVLGTGVALGGALLGWAVACDEPIQAAIGVIASGAVLTVSAHDLGHWVAGRVAGIQFRSYFLDGPFRIQPGLKTEYATYLRATPAARARMHAAGALASKVAPFISLAVWPATEAPGWAALVVLGMGVLQIITDVLWSMKKSDWKKYSRERRFARA